MSFGRPPPFLLPGPILPCTVAAGWEKRGITSSFLGSLYSLLPALVGSSDTDSLYMGQIRVFKHPCSVDSSLADDAWLTHCPLHLCFLLLVFIIQDIFSFK